MDYKCIRAAIQESGSAVRTRNGHRWWPACCGSIQDLELTNLVKACAACNLQKNGTEFLKFLETKTKKEQGAIIRRLDRLGKLIPLQPEERTVQK